MKTALFLMILSSSAFAQYYCTDWTRTSSVSCIFAGRSASLWQRQCENPCTHQNWNPQCDQTAVCTVSDPNEWTSACSVWTKESSVLCLNPNTGRLEQKWVRACQRGLATQWCSNENPNLLMDL